MQVEKSVFSRLGLMIAMLLTTLVTFAQDAKKIDVDISTDSGGGGFFASPWVWVVGAAVFILLLVALLRGGGSRRSA